MSEQNPLDLEGLGINKKVRLGKIESKVDLSDLFAESEGKLEEIRKSWDNSTAILNSDDNGSGGLLLRKSQIGGIMAALAHWTTSNKDANIVMPTGTGKTETMMATMILAKCKKVSIVLPATDLREQTMKKFVGLGILPELQHFNDLIEFPIVGCIEKIPTDRDSIDEIVDHCNVVIATGSALGRMDASLRTYFMSKFSHLFVDEAHHVAAPTWNKIKMDFVKNSKPVLQFTATPFRNDGKHLGGKTIYSFSLRQAYKDEYFKKIHFHAVVEWDPAKSDEAIAKKVIESLETDIDNGLSHQAMARVDSVKRAEEVVEIYKRLAPHLQPTALYSSLKPASAKRIALEKVKNGTAKIVVCVNMLGEGFDLPQLKVAGIHDTHKSLPVTLQFVGRFTRTANDVGEATVVANIVDPKVPKNLENLYSQDANWNSLLEIHSDTAIGKQRELSDFLNNFDYIDDEFSIQNIRPKMSTMVYKFPEGTNWNPEALNQAMSSKSNAEYLSEPAINEEDGVYIQVRGQKSTVAWGKEKHLQNMDWHLYAFYWCKDLNLLFVNSSSNDSSYDTLVEALAGRELEQIRDDVVFRSFSNMHRVIFHNVGLNDTWGASIRYTMFTGIDVEQALDTRTLGTKVKSNIFGLGFENGEKASMGCSYKGRIWSKRNGTIKDYIDWCKELGAKLIDDSIDPHECVLSGSLKRVELTELPESQPIGVEWDPSFYVDPGKSIEIIRGSRKYELWDVSLTIGDQTDPQKVFFKVIGADFESTYSLSYELVEERIRCVYTLENGPALSISVSNKESYMEEFFKRNHPLIRLADGAALVGNISANPRNNATHTFDQNQIQVWDWEQMGTNITSESRGEEELPESIQQTVINELLQQDYEVIFDDDGAGEAADIIAVRKEEDRIKVELYHCKYSSEPNPGARVKDLYEVCGQAMKSIHWQLKGRGIFEHMEHRLKTTKRSNRLAKGGFIEIRKYRDMAEKILPVDASITIVQPGVSKAGVTPQMLSLFGGVEAYLYETYRVKLRVIASK